jgi:hypothetical protein
MLPAGAVATAFSLGLAAPFMLTFPRMVKFDAPEK